MSRCGYDDIDGWDLIRWRGMVASAIRGKRGQALLHDLRQALDEMPERALIAHELTNGDGDVCALGAVARLRQVDDWEHLDPREHEDIGSALNVAPCLVGEIEYINDEYMSWEMGADGRWKQGCDPAKRWQVVSKWVDEQLAKAQGAEVSQ